jgi:hypothetical protein
MTYNNQDIVNNEILKVSENTENPEVKTLDINDGVVELFVKPKQSTKKPKDEKQIEKQRIADEKQIEKQRIADKKQIEKQRIADEKQRIADETQRLAYEKQKEKDDKLKMNRKDKDVFIKCQDINDILNYPVPETFRVIEKIYNHEVFDLLTKINPIIAGYNDIPDAFHPLNIDHLKKLKKYYKKEGHIVDYTKIFYKKGRYYPKNNNKKDDSSSLQNTKSIVRRLLCDGRLKGFDISNAHIEIVKNICRFLKLPKENYSILSNYCENRKKHLDDVKKSFVCDRKTAKDFFIIILFGGDYNTWLIDNNLVNKSKNITPLMSDFIDAYTEIKYEINKLDVLDGFKAIQKKIL